MSTYMLLARPRQDRYKSNTEIIVLHHCPDPLNKAAIFGKIPHTNSYLLVWGLIEYHIYIYIEWKLNLYNCMYCREQFLNISL